MSDTDEVDRKLTREERERARNEADAAQGGQEGTEVGRRHKAQEGQVSPAAAST